MLVGADEAPNSLVCHEFSSFGFLVWVQRMNAPVQFTVQESGDMIGAFDDEGRSWKAGGKGREHPLPLAFNELHRWRPLSAQGACISLAPCRRSRSSQQGTSVIIDLAVPALMAR